MLKDLQMVSVRLILWGFLFLLVVLGWLDQHPITLSVDEEEERAEALYNLVNSDVLLVVSYDEIDDSTEEGVFDETDFSLAWINTLNQEIGPFSIADEDSFDNLDLGYFRVIIITRSAADNDDWALRLKSYVEKGGVLVLEMPQDRLRQTFSADGKGGIRQVKDITFVHGIDDELFEVFKSIPLHTERIGSTEGLADSTTLLKMDSVPVIYSIEMSDGRAITIDFNYGQLLTSLQQGLPEQDFSVENRYPTILSDPIESNDLVMDEDLLNNSTPYADILEKILVHQFIGGSSPLPLLWPIPDGAAGALVMTHDEEGMGDLSTWMADYEISTGGVSTYFLTTNQDLSDDTVAHLRESGIDLGILWKRPFSDQGVYDAIGLWLVKPFRRPHSLKRQLDDLSNVLPPDYLVLASRNHYLLWDETWSGTFRILAAQNIRIDSTYGPEVKCKGYLFGTGYPFTPLDRNGLPHNLLELPFLTSDNLGGADVKFLEKLFKDSQELYHETITLLFHPNAYAYAPSVTLYQMWRSSYSLAETYEHVQLTVSDLYRFNKNRVSSELSSHIRQTTSERGRKGLLMSIEARVNTNKIWLAVPAELQGKSMYKAHRGLIDPSLGADTQELKYRKTNILNSEYRLLPLKKGHNQINVSYF